MLFSFPFAAGNMFILDKFHGEEYLHSSFAVFSVVSLIVFIAYGVGVAVYRLYISPLAKVPGPKLAALTQYYEMYYDLVSGGGGNYTRRIKKMHETYGTYAHS